MPVSYAWDPFALNGPRIPAPPVHHTYGLNLCDSPVQFPGRRALEWMLLMPLAVPAYIGAYALVDFFDYSGALQVGLRALTGWQSAALIALLRATTISPEVPKSSRCTSVQLG